MVSENAAALRRENSSVCRGPDLKLYVRDVRDATGRKRSIVVKSWATVKDAKEAIQQCIAQVPIHTQRLYFGSPLMSSGKELPNYRTLSDAGIYRSGETLFLDIISSDETSKSYLGASPTLQRIQGSNDICISTSLLNSTPKLLSHTIHDARRAFSLGIKPDLIMDGSGGSYYIHDVKKNKIAVFKPADEEPYAENNPRGYLPHQQGGEFEGLRQGIAPGEACIREVAAYLLDHDGFSGVPMTTLAEARHPAFNTNGARLKVSEGGASIGAHSLGSPSRSTSASQGIPKKVGSFQEYVRSECSMDDMSPSKISVEQVHRIAVLDIRLLNADRNAANLLCRRLRDNSIELVPIDHGYCLRSMCDVSWMDWCWLDWPQVKQPMSAKTKDYIKRLDTEKDAKIVQERLNISNVAIDYIRASTALLKAGVEAGMSLYDIAILCCRNDNLAETPSLLEHLTAMASELSKVALDNEEWHHATASRALEEQLSPYRSSNVQINSGIKSRDRSSSRFHRCASSGEFLVSIDVEDENPRSNLSLALGQSHAPPPPLALSSGSDSSGDNNEDVKEDQEEIEEWAHNIIEDFQPVPHARVGRKTRSGSSSDEESLSTSPKGFWHVPPGSVGDASSKSSSYDDDSFGTSPMISDNFVGPSPETLDEPLRRRTSVTFADMDDEKPPSHALASDSPPTMVLLSHQLLSTTPKLHRLESGASIPRSKSYTSLSRRFSSNLSSVPSTVSKTAETRNIQHNDHAEDHEFYRAYFLKFIDLVISREMARLQVHASETS